MFSHASSLRAQRSRKVSRTAKLRRKRSRNARGLLFERLECRSLLASDITIVQGALGSGSLDGFLSATDGTIAVADGGASPGTVSTGALEDVGAAVDISITAQGS